MSHHHESLAAAVRAYGEKNDHPPDHVEQVIRTACYRMAHSTSPVSVVVAACCVELELRKGRQNGKH